MDSRSNQDRLSNLSDILLILIISNLPFKEAVNTSVLAKRWKNLYRETTNVSFQESKFVKCSVSDDEETKTEAVSFVDYMVDWVSGFSGQVIERFELCLSKPVGFETEINSLVGFAITKKVKDLVLDFSDPSWINSNQASVFQSPECVYNHLATLVSLKLFACGFNPSRVAKFGSMKRLCFGWINLGKIESLILKSPLLESLTIQNCVNVGLEMITRDNDRLIELIFENCDFAAEYSTLDLTNIQIFKYSGKVHYFQFMEVNKNMKEAYLDFGAATEYNDATGTHLSGLLYDLKSAKKLTVCPFLTQLIKDSDDPVLLQAPMETRQLVIKTNMQPNEFVGIRLMINSCPDLETLTFVMVPPRPDTTTALGFDPDKYWTLKITHKCLKSTLKVVEVRSFSGGLRECQVLQYLIRYGRVLERVDLYLSSELEEGQKILARAAAQMIGTKFAKGSSRLTILLHNI